MGTATVPPSQTTTVVVRGELDASTCPRLREALERAIDDGARAVAVDVSEVTFMDSSTITTLIIAANDALERRVAFGLVEVPLVVRRTLDVAGLGVFLDLQSPS